VTAATTVTLTASYAGVTRSDTLKVTRPPALNALSLSATTVASGGTVTGTVKLTKAAGPGGVTVLLASANGSAANVPPSVTVAAGATLATFPIQAGTVSSNTQVAVTARYDGVQKSATLTVTP
jgi:hypothetical protein